MSGSEVLLPEAAVVALISSCQEPLTSPRQRRQAIISARCTAPDGWATEMSGQGSVDLERGRAERSG